MNRTKLRRRFTMLRRMTKKNIRTGGGYLDCERGLHVVVFVVVVVVMVGSTENERGRRGERRYQGSPPARLGYQAEPSFPGRQVPYFTVLYKQQGNYNQRPTHGEKRAAVVCEWISTISDRRKVQSGSACTVRFVAFASDEMRW